MPKRILQGVVISDKQNKTVVVEVKRSVKHPKYQKIMTLTKKYSAHDENNEKKVGDVVDIIESRPISKNKSWVVVGAESTEVSSSETAKEKQPAKQKKEKSAKE